jgi:hypothetical protein
VRPLNPQDGGVSVVAANGLLANVQTCERRVAMQTRSETCGPHLVPTLPGLASRRLLELAEGICYSRRWSASGSYALEIRRR